MGLAYIYGQHLEHKLAEDLCVSRHLRKALNYDVGVYCHSVNSESRLGDDMQGKDDRPKIRMRDVQCDGGGSREAKTISPTCGKMTIIS